MLSQLNTFVQTRIGQWLLLALLCGVGVTLSSPVSADCTELMTGTGDMDWDEDDPEWIKPVAGVPATPVTLGPGIAVSVPYLMFGGLQDEHPLDPLVNLSLLPGCLTYETISTPLQVIDTVLDGPSEAGSDTEFQNAESPERIDRTSISPPELGPEPQRPTGRDNDGK